MAWTGEWKTYQQSTAVNSTGSEAPLKVDGRAATVNDTYCATTIQRVRYPETLFDSFGCDVDRQGMS